MRYLYFTSKQFHNHNLLDVVNHDKVGEYVKGRTDYIDYMDNVKKIHINEYNRRNNFDSSKLPKIVQANASYEATFDNDNLLTLFDDIILARSIEHEENKYEHFAIKHFEELLENIVKVNQNFTNFESMVFSFEQIVDPDKILDKMQLSAFHLFALYENKQALEYTLKLGTSINCRTSIGHRDFPGATALHIATVYKKLDMIKYLIEQGIRIDERDLNGNSALHLAAAGGFTKIVQYFYEIGANFLLSNKRNLIPMNSSIMGDNIETFKLCKKAAEEQFDISKLQAKERKIYLRNPTLAGRTKEKLSPLMLSIINN